MSERGGVFGRTLRQGSGARCGSGARLGWLLVIAAGCAPEPLQLELAPDALVAFVILDEADQVIGGSPVRRAGEGPAWLPEPPKRVLVYVWPPGAEGPSFGLGATEAVRAASGCVPRLPPPSEVRGLRGARLPDPLPALTAPWLEGQCPSDLDPERIEVQTRCGRLVECDKIPVPLGPCRYGIEVSAACNVAPLEVVFDWAGRACIDSAIGCEPRAETGPDFVGAATCSFEPRDMEPFTCEVEVGRAPATPPFSIDGRIPLHDVIPVLPGFTLDEGLLNDDDLVATLAPDLAVTDRRAAVLTFEPMDTLETRRRCTGDAGAHEVRLRTFDLDTLEPGPTWPLPPCTAWLERTPEGDGLFIGYPDREAGGWRVARLDEDGRTVAERLLEPAELPLSTSELRELELGDGRLAVAFETDDGRTLVQQIDPLTLEDNRPRIEVVGRSWQVGLGGATVATLLNLPGDDFAMFRTGVDGPELGMFVPRGGKFVFPLDAVHEASTGVTLGVIARDIPGVVIWPPSRAPVVVERQGASSYQPARILTLPTEPTTAVVAAIRQNPSWAASLRWLDVERFRFRPGELVLGLGVPNRLRIDRAGRIWVLLGWAGQIVRSSPS